MALRDAFAYIYYLHTQSHIILLILLLHVKEGVCILFCESVLSEG